MVQNTVRDLKSNKSSFKSTFIKHIEMNYEPLLHNTKLLTHSVLTAVLLGYKRRGRKKSNFLFPSKRRKKNRLTSNDESSLLLFFLH